MISSTCRVERARRDISLITITSPGDAAAQQHANFTLPPVDLAADRVFHHLRHAQFPVGAVLQHPKFLRVHVLVSVETRK